MPFILLGCGSPPSPAKATAPAKVTAGVTEASLTTITLTAQAVERLGIETAAVEQRGMVRTRTVGVEMDFCLAAEQSLEPAIVAALSNKRLMDRRLSRRACT